ncbi:HTH-type transcriptional repressor Bm3R1 [Klebsiella pneumoniae]|nr:HTH-type transcriptional repressor Bm3R1 [Klebsiella pneumoniae]
MARPKSEDKKQALLEAATAAFAQSGIAASTSAIARSAGVAEGTLFRYFATKDELLNELYLAIKLRLVRTMIAGLDPDEKRPKENARNIWNSYIDWGVRNPMEHKAIRRMALSERITDETRRQVKESFPELNEMCQLSVKEIFLSEAYRAIKLRLVRTMIAGLDPDEKRPKENARNIWNSYIDWGVRNPMEHKAIRRMALSERITDETRRQVKESFPELNEMCQLSVKEIFLSEAYRAFGDALFLSLAETTIEFASHDPQRAREIIALGFEAMWHALHEADA